jgi:hypothetical protein
MHITQATVFSQLGEVLRGESLALMLFGSQARGDDGDLSDTDILQLAPSLGKSYRAGRFTVSVYTPASLEVAAAAGSLFVLHLLTDGIVLDDRLRILSRCLGRYVRPPSYEPFFEELRGAANLLNVSNGFYREHWERCNSLALFLLRSALYGRTAACDRPLFSVPAIAEEERDNRILEAYQLKYSAAPDLNWYWRCANLALEYIEARFTTKPDAVMELIMNVAGRSDLTRSLGLRLLGLADGAGYNRGR